MLKADFFDSQYENSSEAIYVEKVDDIIGRKLANELTVVGIFSTDDGIYDFMEPLIDLDDEELKAREDYENISSIKSGVSLAK